MVRFLSVTTEYFHLLSWLSNLVLTVQKAGMFVYKFRPEVDIFTLEFSYQIYKIRRITIRKTQDYDTLRVNKSPRLRPQGVVYH